MIAVQMLVRCHRNGSKYNDFTGVLESAQYLPLTSPGSVEIVYRFVSTPFSLPPVDLFV